MLNKAVIFAGLTFTLLFRASVFAGGKNELADKYYSLLQGADGTSAKFVWAELYKEVSPSERDELFASIIDRGMKAPNGLTNPGAIAWILDALGSTGPNRAWSPNLERVVLAQAKNKDPVIRGLLPDALSMHGRAKYRTLCLSYLDDPDKGVRLRAVDAIGPWPDGKAILGRYVEDHRSNDNPADPADPVDPVKRAKQLIAN